MNFIEKMDCCERILNFIRRKATGTPRELAERLSISESTLYECIKMLKMRGAQIEYCSYRQTYILHNDFQILFGCSNAELKKINGGTSISLFTPKK